MANETIDAITVTADTAAKIFGIGRTKWYEMDSAGKIPAPLRFGRRVVWVRDELVAWAKAGMPNREKWESMKNRQ